MAWYPGLTPARPMARGLRYVPPNSSCGPAYPAGYQDGQPAQPMVCVDCSLAWVLRLGSCASGPASGASELCHSPHSCSPAILLVRRPGRARSISGPAALRVSAGAQGPGSSFHPAPRFQSPGLFSGLGHRSLSKTSGDETKERPTRGSPTLPGPWSWRDRRGDCPLRGTQQGPRRGLLTKPEIGGQVERECKSSRAEGAFDSHHIYKGTPIQKGHL